MSAAVKTSVFAADVQGKRYQEPIAIPQAAAATSNHPLSLVDARDLFPKVTSDSLLWFSPGSAMYGVPLRSPPDEPGCNICARRERFAAEWDG
jgi:hypothetical protein